ncbi:MAG: type II toxin-antitoxin system YafQ family toxin [Chromatiales bacterium]|nr:type II toxin-antitoxin system YafQ family toxin [Chromatiales bacterium]
MLSNRPARTGASYRECHLKSDLLLAYRKPDAETLQPVRPGSHGKIFG